MYYNVIQIKVDLPLSQPKQDDEIDLIEMFEYLWAGKWIISVLLGISLAIGFSFNFYKKKSLPPPHFMVVAPYSVNLPSPFVLQICAGDLECAYDRVSNNLKRIAQDSWFVDDIIIKQWENAGIDLELSQPECPLTFCLELSSRRSPIDTKLYYEQLQDFNEILTRDLVAELKDELLKLSKNTTYPKLPSELFGNSFLELSRYLNNIENGQMVINFEEIYITEVMAPNRQNLIIVLSFVLGGFLGCAVVLIRAAILNRRAALGQS